MVRGTNNKPVSSEALAKFFAAEHSFRGQLLIGYPIIGTTEGRYPIDAVLVSPEKGIVVFDLIEGTEPGDFAERQDDSANKLEARLRTYKELTVKRQLVIPLSTVSFAPGVANPELFDVDEYPLANVASLDKAGRSFARGDGRHHP